MKILNLQADNFKRLKVVDITPKGSLVPITGRNANGKTSVLDCIWAAIGGASHIQSEPIRKGTTKAKIRLNLGEIVVTRSFSKGGTQLVVENAEGMAYKAPQRMLDDLVGALSFDPLEFSRMKPRDQFDELRKLAHVDLDLDKLDGANAQDYRARTDVNRDAKVLWAQAEGITLPEDPGPTEDASALMDALDALQGAKDEEGRASTSRAELEQAIEQKRGEFQRKREELIVLKEAITDLETTQSSLLDPVDTTALDLRITALRLEITNHSTKAAAKAAHAAAVQRCKDLETQAKAKDDYAEKLTAQMDTRIQTKLEAIAKAKMPIPGLGFGDGMVLYNEVPFDQASSAEQLRISTAIAMAANPKLRVIRIADGSLLDEANMAMLAKMAEDQDFQVWVEVVDSTGKVGIYIEDGEVKADNQETLATRESVESVGISDNPSDHAMDATHYLTNQQAVAIVDAATEVLPWDPSTPVTHNSDTKLTRRHATGADLDIP